MLNVILRPKYMVFRNKPSDGTTLQKIEKQNQQKKKELE